jgi:hypothetical protein
MILQSATTSGQNSKAKHRTPYNHTLQQTGGAAVLRDSVVLSQVGGGAAPAAERGRYEAENSITNPNAAGRHLSAVEGERAKT